ncbi:MAG: acyltransferase family protein [Pseudomonadota bacterium]
MMSPQSASGALAHRPEIDGLRSIAVLSVVLYHFGVPGLPGGFVGVDVFFVISGFLIGAILIRELEETGRIALLRFYTRRFRRLAPAFFAMVFATAIVGYFLVLPFEFREFGKTVIASTTYLSNVLFYMQSGYFDAGSETKFLLHTWSLSVEEQFYVFLPFCLLLFCRRKALLIPVLGGFFALSLAANLYTTPVSHSAAFYLFPFRAWEMLAGVLLAAYGYRRNETWAHGAWASWAGLALVIGGILFIQPGESFPGFPVLAPVLGTALLIWNGQADNLVNRMLFMRGPVLIGLMSYSLYLWHWPVLTLSLYYRGEYAHAGEVVFWLALAALISWASWRFIERPVRGISLKRMWALLAGAGALSASALGMGALLFLKDGLPSRFSPEVQIHIAASQDFLQDWSRCGIADEGAFAGLELCRIGPEGAEPDFLAWGDSHMRGTMAGLELAAQEAGRAGLILWKAGCPPFFDIEKEENSSTRIENQSCGIQNQKVRAALAQADRIRDVILLGRWAYYANGTGVGIDAGYEIRLSPREGVPLPDGPGLFAAALEQTVLALAEMGKSVSILRQPPEVQDYTSFLFARRLVNGQLGSTADEEAQSTVSLEALAERNAAAEPALRGLAEDGAITFLDTWPVFCDAARCSAVTANGPAYYDNNHLTNGGGVQIKDVILKALLRD